MGSNISRIICAWASRDSRVKLCANARRSNLYFHDLLGYNQHFTRKSQMFRFALAISLKISFYFLPSLLQAICLVILILSILYLNVLAS